MRFRDKIASGLGSVLEWYDFSLYGFFAPLIAQLYFPNNVPMVGLFKTFSVFAIGFFARPLGALIFGYISDRYGRTVTLRITPLLITCPTLLFCFLPTYEQIGLFAPALLLFLRVVQGICIGGEYTNNIVYLCEGTKKKNLYFIGSIGSCTGSLGILLASTIATICYSFFTPQYLYSYGFRYAFGVSLVIGIAAFLMRRNIKESKIFLDMKKTIFINNPVLDSYKKQWRDYLLSFGLTFLPATAFYYVFMFLPSFLAGTLHYNFSKILNDNSLSLLIRLFIIPIVGFIASKIGGIKIARLSCFLFLVLSAPLFYSILYYPSFAIISIFLFALLTTLNAATTPGLLIEILKPETRCTIFSFTFNVCFGIFGGITPIISFLLIHSTGSMISPIFYLIFSATITFIATFFFDNRIIQYEKNLLANPH